ncbi:MAG: hypothetical protein SF028_14885 [Candidatus Sumerlaeia bacterium]|nr:hypothetical protein [Candidatus Sumerlaeia bacterium]
MTHRHPPAAAALAALLLAGAAPAQTTYTFTDIHPAGQDNSLCAGISPDGSRQVGDASTGVFFTNFVGVGGRWAGNAASFAAMTATGYDQTLGIYLNDTDGTRHVGWAFPQGTFFTDAMLWNTTNTNGVSIHPTTGGFSDSEATGVSGSLACGYAIDGGGAKAGVWSGSGFSTFTVIHPAGALTSSALDIRGTHVVGVAQFPGPISQAAYWPLATEASFVNLAPPSGYGASRATATDGIKQSGFAISNDSGLNHAMIWSGTASSFVDVHPPAFDSSRIQGAAPGIQVGFGEVGGARQALLWRGSLGTLVNLHEVLGAGYVESEAFDVSDSGVVVGYAITTGGASHAILWTPQGASSAAGWQLYE